MLAQAFVARHDVQVDVQAWLQVCAVESHAFLQASLLVLLSHPCSHESFVFEHVFRHADAVSVQAHGAASEEAEESLAPPPSPTTRVSVPTMSEQPHNETTLKTRTDFTRYLRST